MTTSSMLEMVERFNRDLIGITIPDRPTILSEERGLFRHNHLEEELVEFYQALSDKNFEDVTDSLLDLIYVAMGALVEMGIAPGPAFEEVHAANMAKRRGSLSKRPGSLGYDAVKPEGWQPPDLEPYLTLTRKQVLGLEDIPVRMTGTDRRLLRNPRPKVLIIGYGRHGKDTVAEMLKKHLGFSFVSSSYFCAEEILFPLLKDKYGYADAQACFEDRHNHRTEWFDAIRAFNTPDLIKLGRVIFQDFDILCGVRNKAELHAIKNAGLADHIIWVDRSGHVAPELPSSCTVAPWMADYVLDNNGSIEDLERNLLTLMENLL